MTNLPQQPQPLPTPPGEPPQRRKRGSKVAGFVVGLLGDLFITAGFLLLSFAFYESYWTNIEASQEQNRVAEQLEERWAAAPAPAEDAVVNRRGHLTPQLGEAFARMYIPAFGSDFHFAIVEGTSDADLLAGPGRYTDTQLPGEPGNFAVAGHRVGKGAPFNDLGNLRSCDAVVVETSNTWEIYRMLPVEGDDRATAAAKCLSPEQVERVVSGDYATVPGREITFPGDVGTIAPLPGFQVTDTSGLEGLMTMTTCHPQFSNAQRMILHAMHVRTDPKTAGYKPAELEAN